MSIKTKTILVRFAKGFISGAVSAMGLVTIAVPTVWTGFLPILNMLAIAGMAGGLNGLLLALQKWSSWRDEEPIV